MVLESELWSFRLREFLGDAYGIQIDYDSDLGQIIVQIYILIHLVARKFSWVFGDRLGTMEFQVESGSQLSSVFKRRCFWKVHISWQL